MKVVVVRDVRKPFGVVELIACQNGIALANGGRRWRYAVRTPEMATGFTSDHETAQRWYDLISGMMPTAVLNCGYRLETP